MPEWIPTHKGTVSQKGMFVFQTKIPNVNVLRFCLILTPIYIIFLTIFSGPSIFRWSSFIHNIVSSGLAKFFTLTFQTIHIKKFAHLLLRCSSFLSSFSDCMLMSLSAVGGSAPKSWSTKDKIMIWFDAHWVYNPCLGS